MRDNSFKLLRFVVIALVVATAILSALQLETKAEAEDAALCGSTGQPCNGDDDCTNLNPTCFCAILADGRGVCREDFPIPPIKK